jgi:NADPH:quinone reductase-like Zn-dependent oxidoreductase
VPWQRPRITRQENLVKALCWHGKKDIRCDEVPDPQIEHPRDAIVKVTSCAICGSDLHLFNGFVPGMKHGDILGHEFMGEVMEVGSENTSAAANASSAAAATSRSASEPTATRTWPTSSSGTAPPGFSATRT